MHRTKQVFPLNRACYEGFLRVCKRLRKVTLGTRRVILGVTMDSLALALVSSIRNKGLRAQTSIFTIKNQYCLVQAASATAAAAATATTPLLLAVAVAASGFCPFGIEFEKQGFRMPWDIRGHKFQELGLKLKAFILTFRDLDRNVCQKIGKWRVGVFEMCEFCLDLIMVGMFLNLLFFGNSEKLKQEVTCFPQPR